MLGDGIGKSLEVDAITSVIFVIAAGMIVSGFAFELIPSLEVLQYSPAAQ